MVRPDLYGNDTGSKRVKTFTIPVSGSVRLFGPEIDVVESKAFQRLAGLKQLGTSYVVFRGALHTRFEHSLGALFQAEKMLSAIERNPRASWPICDKAWRIARLGALLHDLPHVPFGHTLEDEFHLLARHDENKVRCEALLERSEIGHSLQTYLPEGEFEELVRVLSAKTEEEVQELDFPFVADIVGNTVCADLLDYVERDLRACGMPVAMGDRFLDYLGIAGANERPENRLRIVLNLDKRGMPRPDVESEVIKLLSYRYELAERVYFHHAKNAASVMIGRAVQDAGLAVGTKSPESIDKNFHWLSDEMLLQALAQPHIADELGLCRSDDVTEEGIHRAALLAQGVIERKLYKIAYIGVHEDLASGAERLAREYGDPNQRRGLEDQLSLKADLAPGDVLVHVPRTKMMQKPAEVRVRTSSGEIITLNDWDRLHSRRVIALNEAHERLWRIAVYINPLSKECTDLVCGAAEDVFRARSRYTGQRQGSSYLRAVFDRYADKNGWNHGDLARIQAIAAFDEAVGLEDHVSKLDTLIHTLREDPAQDAEGPQSS